MLHHVPSFDLLTSNRNTRGDGVLLYVRDTINANKLVNFSVMFEHLETIFVSFSVGEINYVIGNVYRPPNPNSDDFMSELSNILTNAVTEFLNSIFLYNG